VNESFDSDLPFRKTGEPRGFLSQRVFWHSVGILLALAVAWLVFQAYRQPEFLIDFGNMQLC
jgi:hypothetical protein